jgi:hypothetical protein
MKDLNNCISVLIACEFSVAALFVRADSVYKSMAGVDAWDKDRDGRLYEGAAPIVAHPPCRFWGAMRNCWNASPLDPAEKALGSLAISLVRINGGVVEHPAKSTLWDHECISPGEGTDRWGGYSIILDQYVFGHRAAKSTRLYIVGCPIQNLPPIPVRAGIPRHVVTNSHGMRQGDKRWRPRVTNKEREATPPAFAKWLVEVARLCRRTTD